MYGVLFFFFQKKRKKKFLLLLLSAFILSVRSPVVLRVICHTHKSIYIRTAHMVHVFLRIFNPARSCCCCCCCCFVFHLVPPSTVSFFSSSHHCYLYLFYPLGLFTMSATFLQVIQQVKMYADDGLNNR